MRRRKKKKKKKKGELQGKGEREQEKCDLQFFTTIQSRSRSLGGECQVSMKLVAL